MRVGWKGIRIEGGSRTASFALLVTHTKSVGPEAEPQRMGWDGQIWRVGMQARMPLGGKMSKVTEELRSSSAGGCPCINICTACSSQSTVGSLHHLQNFAVGLHLRVCQISVAPFGVFTPHTTCMDLEYIMLSKISITKRQTI